MEGEEGGIHRGFPLFSHWGFLLTKLQDEEWRPGNLGIKQPRLLGKTDKLAFTREMTSGGHCLSGKNGCLLHARTILSAGISAPAHTPASYFLFGLVCFFFKVYLNVVHLAPGTLTPPPQPHS